MQNTMPEKGFFGHEIFLVDLNEVFFLFFRFWTVNALSGRKINKTIKQSKAGVTNCALSDFILLLLLFIYFFLRGGRGAGGGSKSWKLLVVDQ